MKKAISATIDEKLLKWIEKELKEEQYRYRNKSHLIEHALHLLKQQKEGKHGTR